LGSSQKTLRPPLVSQAGYMPDHESVVNQFLYYNEDRTLRGLLWSWQTKT